MSYYVTHNNSFLDIKNAHLRVAGNVHADTVHVGAVEFNPGAPKYTETVRFSNAHSGLVTTSNLDVQGTLILNGIEIGASLDYTLQNITGIPSGNITSNPIVITNATTGIDSSGNVHASAFYGNGTKLTGVALANDLASNDARITSLSTFQTSNNARIDTVTDNIFSNASRIATLETIIASLEARVLALENP
jgi:hypothetical protein